jgi:hypothetical protein
MSSEKLPSSPALRGWRFSLQTLLLVFAIICLAVPLILQSLKLRDARVELRQLRDQLGYLTVDDRSQVHIIAVDMNEPDTWRWRMFLPQGARYTWCLGYGDIPAKGVPKPKISSTSNEPYSETETEIVVTAKLRQMDDGNWSLSVSSSIGGQRAQMGGARVTIPAEEMRRFREVSSYEGLTRGKRGTEKLDPKGPIDLLQWRTTERQPDGSHQPSVNPMPGYMIWLEKVYC